MKLSNGSETERLKGSFIPYSIDTPSVAPPDLGNYDDPHFKGYQAISYTWGGEEKASITIHEDSEKYEIDISQNLKNALRAVRSPNEDLFIWADALCINQNDKEEKSSQIQRMAEIYTKAKCVCVWLGEGNVESDKAFAFMKKLSEPNNSVLGSFAREEWAAFVALSQRKWFNRRWIVQEITRAQRAVLYCGERNATWTDFADVLSLFLRHQYTKQPTLDPADGLDSIEDVSQLGAVRLVEAWDNLFRRTPDGKITEPLLSLEALMSSLTAFEASEPRDAVYAILSLSNDAVPKTRDAVPKPRDAAPKKREGAAKKRDSAPRPREEYQQDTPESTDGSHDYDQDSNMSDSTFASRTGKKRKRNSGLASPSQSPEQGKERPKDFIVDYNQEVVEVYEYFLGFCMERSQSLDMICWPWAPDAVSNKYKLPTWIPTLSKASFAKTTKAYCHRVNADPLVGQPGPGEWPKLYSASKGYEAFWRFENGSLIVKGFEIGRIMAMKDVARRNIHRSWRDTVGWTRLQDELPNEFWQTLVGNRNSQGKRPPRFWGRVCKEAFEKFETPEGEVNVKERMNDADPIMKEFLERVYCVTLNRRLVKIKPAEDDSNSKMKPDDKSTLIGLAPEQVELNDVVCVLHGCSVPVVLRKIDHNETEADGNSHARRALYELVGECYIHGMMDGEAFDETRTANEFELR
jgi:Heterokaryon incompatibility protein (HET)